MCQRTGIVELVGKQTNHEKRTHDHLPPLFDLLILCHAKVCPTQGLFSLLETILNLSSEAVVVANLLKFDGWDSDQNK